MFVLQCIGNHRAVDEGGDICKVWVSVYWYLLGAGLFVWFGCLSILYLTL